MLDFGSLMDMTYVVGIIGLTKVLTAMDSGRKFERFYPAIPLVFAAIAAYFVTIPFDLQVYGGNAFKFVTAATYIYKFGKTTVLGK